MRNSHKFNFIIYCFIQDMTAIVIGTLIFLKVGGDEYFGCNTMLINKVILTTVLSWIFSVTYFQLYRADVFFSLDFFFRNSWRAFLTQTILWYSYLLFFQDNILNFMLSRANLIHLSFLVSYFLISRILFTLLIVKFKGWVAKPYTVAIWGFNKTSIELASHLEANSFFSDFVGILNENSSVNYKNREDFSSALANAIHEASEANINEVYIVTKPNFILDLNYFFELGDRHCMRLNFVPDFSSISKVHFSNSNFNNFHVIKPRYEPLEKAYNRMVKRLFDLVFSVLVIVFILSWLYPLLAIIIKKQSNGPVLYKQLRTGKKNRPFWCYKFRSMYINMGDECQQAKIDDIRITPIGKFLRHSSLDEMPQFFNVLMGTMSIVGPRPHMIKHTTDYNDNISNFMVRHFVKPGITGLSQVSGLRGETKKVSDMKRRVNTDIKYVRQWCLKTDIKICFLTVVVIFKGDKNAF